MFVFAPTALLYPPLRPDLLLYLHTLCVKTLARGVRVVHRGASFSSRAEWWPSMTPSRKLLAVHKYSSSRALCEYQYFVATATFYNYYY